MYYLVHFHKNTNQQTEKLPTRSAAKRWAILVRRNGYTVDKIVTKGETNA